jgi:hypothetical protein
VRDEIRKFVFAAFSLEVQDRIVRSTADNTLHFYCRIRRIASSSLPAGTTVNLSNIHRLIPAPAPDSIYLDWRPDGLGSLAPTWGRYSYQPGGQGTFYFYFDPNGASADTPSRLPAIPDDGSRFMYAATAATNYREVPNGILIETYRSGSSVKESVQQAGFVPAWS